MNSYTIGQLTDAFTPITDGVVSVVKNYAYYLQQNQIHSPILTPDFPGYRDDTELTVLRYQSVPLPRRKPYRIGLPKLSPRFLQQLRKIDFDLVHAHSPFASAKLALTLARKRNIPCVATFHSKYYEDIKAVTKSDLIAKHVCDWIVKCYHQFDHVFTVNAATAETLRSYGFTKNIRIIPNGTDLTPLTDKQRALRALNQQLDLHAGTPVLLFVGQHIWQKNIRLIIDALSILNQRQLNFTLLFVGDGQNRDAIKHLINKRGLSAKVKFLGTVRDRQRLTTLYTRADLFIFPSRYDTSAVVMQEAASTATPSLVIAGSNTAEEIKDNINGFLSENDKVVFADRLQQLLAQPELLAQVGQVASETLSRSWQQIVLDLKLQYLDIIRAGVTS